MFSRDGKIVWFIAALMGCVLVFATALGAVTSQSLNSAKPAWFLFSIGCGLILLGSSAARGHTVFGLVSLSLFAGGAAVLWLTEPLFFPSINDDFSSVGDIVAGFMLLAQAAISLSILWPERQRAGTLVLRIGVLRLIILAAIGAALSVSIMNYLPQGYYGGFAKQTVLGGAIMGIQLLSIATLLFVPAPAFLRVPKTPFIAAIIAGISSALMAWLAVEFVPHVEDELAYLFQARTFLGGHLSVPLPPTDLSNGLDYYLLTQTDGRWMSVTTPGWPAILTIGVALGQPWLLNPILAALSVFLAYRVCARLLNAETAALVAVLLAASPWFIESAATLMPHLAALVFTLLSWWVLSRSNDRAASIFAAGLFMGVVFTIRQLEAVLIGTLTGGVLLVLFWQRGRPLLVLAYGLGCVVTGAILLAYNHIMTGSALLAPLQIYLDSLWHEGANSYGFGPDIGPKERWGALDYAAGHTLTEAIVITAHNLFYVNFELFGWAAGSVLLALFHLLFGRHNRLDGVAWAVIVIVPLAHLGYWFSGSFYIGPRYWFAMLLPMVYLSARGAMSLRERANINARQIEATLMVLCIFSLSVFVTWRGTEKFYGYGNYSGQVRLAAETGQFGNDLVVYEATGNPGEALFLNDPYLPKDRPIYVTGPASEIDPPCGRNIAIWTD